MTTQIEHNVEKIRQAWNEEITYWRQSNPTATWIGFASLRESAGLTRPDFDAAILHLIRTDRTAVIVPESNQKVLRPQDREAAVWIGNQWKHLITFD